jgi:ABC-type Zn uptake system ZnuABC Zn-binding protein ZnuA
MSPMDASRHGARDEVRPSFRPGDPRPARRTAAGSLGLVLVLLAVACGAEAGQSASSVGRLAVVTTTTVFADIVRNVGGARVSVESIIPAGVGPEDYEPKPDDARKLATAGLVVKNGIGLDDFLDKLLDATATNTPLLTLGDGIPTLTVDGKPNPHLWLDPTLVRDRYLPAIAARLSELDPAGRSTFEANAAAYAGRLDQLDATLKARVATIPTANRKLVTLHDAFPYFARHFGFELIGVILRNVGQDPTAADLADLVAQVRAAHVTAVFGEAQFSSKLARTLADEAGIERVVTTIYSDALGPAPADTYLGMMSWNIDQIVMALS